MALCYKIILVSESSQASFQSQHKRWNWELSLWNALGCQCYENLPGCIIKKCIAQYIANTQYTKHFQQNTVHNNEIAQVQTHAYNYIPTSRVDSSGQVTGGITRIGVTNAVSLGSIGKNGTSNFTNASEWAWHVESRAWYAEVTGYTATTVHVHFGHYWPARILRAQGEFLPSIKATLSPSLLYSPIPGHMGACSSPILGLMGVCPRAA